MFMTGDNFLECDTLFFVVVLLHPTRRYHMIFRYGPSGASSAFNVGASSACRQPLKISKLCKMHRNDP